MYLRYFVNYLPLEKGVALHVNKFSSPSHKDALCPSSLCDALWQVWLKFALLFWRRIFWNFVNVLSLFRNDLPFEKSVALHLNKLYSHFPRDALCQVWLKLANWFFRRRFLNFVHSFSVNRNYLPLEKELSLYFQNWNFLHPGQRCFVPSLVKIDLMILEIFKCRQCI